MTLAVSQPTYIPSANYFDLIDCADNFIFLNDVKMEKSSWHHRNRIKKPEGEHFLTVPVICPNGILTMINEVELIPKTKWNTKHLKTIQQNYRRSYYYDEVFPFVFKLYSYATNNLSDWTIHTIVMICRKIGINTKFYNASSLQSKGKKDYRLVEFCKEIGCDTYISAPAGKNYIEIDNPGGQFVLNRIKLKYQEYEYPMYEQVYGEFMPYLSILDLLFNVGFDRTLEVLRSGRK